MLTIRTNRTNSTDCLRMNLWLIASVLEEIKKPFRYKRDTDLLERVDGYIQD